MLAARGIDIAELPCVFNYELPYSPEDYVHRIGRTGRAGASGRAVSLVSPDEDKLLAGVERFINRKLDITPLPTPPAPSPVRLAPPPLDAVTADDDAPAFRSRRGREPVCALFLPPVRSGDNSVSE